MERTGTSRFAERLLPTLSGGERQRVFLAAAIAQGARVLLLDEPTAFLDPNHRLEVQRALARLRGEGVTILAVTHEVNEALLAGDRVAVLREGRVVFCGGPEALVREGVLERVYGTRFRFQAHPETGRPFVLPEAPR
jgi:iron complex transport system ATP-binding protein